jgi:signal transduction histidine kinase
MSRQQRLAWRYVRGLAALFLLWGLFAAVLTEPVLSWLHGDEQYDEAAIKEWLAETRVYRETLRHMAREFRRELDRSTVPDPMEDVDLRVHADRIREHIKALGDLTKIYPGQLPLFLLLDRITLTFEEKPGAKPVVIAWDAHSPLTEGQYRELVYPLEGVERTRLSVLYQAHAYNKKQKDELVSAQRFRWILLLTVAGTAVSLLWLFLVQNRERARERQRLLSQQQIDQAEHLRLEEELRRREAERRHEEAERKLLEQRLATQAAEGQALELKSQLYASIGIMAGSYAHNIKNLLVRPNDLLRRCLEVDGLSNDQTHMLHEVRQTLGTVTERLQQILRTVRRDPSRSELAQLDLNGLVTDLHRTWEELARDKWKLALRLDLDAGSLWMEGDHSHLQQAVENLLFNARDATFEMRSRLREDAHRREDLSDQGRREALIAAAAWRGLVCLRTRRQEQRAILEVEDNGSGMTDEVRRRCTETHFSTKRDNAIHEGNSTGMGLGLSFVAVILAHHHATLEILSKPGKGALMRIVFPLLPMQSKDA